MASFSVLKEFSHPVSVTLETLGCWTEVGTTMNTMWTRNVTELHFYMKQLGLLTRLKISELQKWVKEAGWKLIFPYYSVLSG